MPYGWKNKKPFTRMRILTRKYHVGALGNNLATVETQSL